MTTIWIVALAVITGLLVVGDITNRRLDNRLVATLGVLVVAGMILTSGDDWVGFGWVVLAALVAAAVTLGLWAAGQIGGGDVKIAPLVFALVTRFGSTAWLVYLAIAIIVAVATLVVHMRRQHDETWVIPLGPTLLSGLVPAVIATLLFA